eukprot:symbB.v1.2.003922.t1/scaffold210.1/size302740/13
MPCRSLSDEDILLECGITEESTVFVTSGLDGGGKKRKKKTYTKPKKIKHKRKKVKLAVLNLAASWNMLAKDCLCFASVFTVVAEPAGSSMEETMVTAAPAAAADQPFYGGKEPPPPTWDGSDPGYELANFEKNVKLWLFESELDPKKRGVRLLRSLTGVARSVVDTLDFDEVACEKGVDNIVQTLRKHFAPHLEVSLPRAFERAVYGAPRGAKESMQEYLIRCERNFNLLEKEDLKLPPGAVGYIMYRQASLTEGQELKFATWSGGKYDAATVISCLRKLDKVIPEHKTKSSTAFVQEGFEEGDDAYLVEPEDAFDDDEYIFLEETDQGQVMEEEDVQLALATYQEIRKAINAQQKGRQFYNGKGAGRGSQGFKNFFKGKQKIRVEELKLRTRCGRCGQVGHWAKECVNEPDERGKKFAAKGSQGGPKSSSAASSVSQRSSSTAQQSWYVAAGSGTCDSNEVEQIFTFVCRGDHATWVGKNSVQDNRSNVKSVSLDYEDKSIGESDLKGIVRDSVLDVASVESSKMYEPPDPFSLFVGLTTTPTMAVVDTAAQDGLIGSHALERLKVQLASNGLQIVWTGRQAKAHGVGGQAKVLGIAAIPLGIAGTSGVLEATVVEGEIPLLLPIKMLRHLRAVIDLNHGHVQFHELHKTVPMFVLPSGHVAIEVCQFGSDGFSLQESMESCGMPTESDFRLNDVFFGMDPLAAFRRALRPREDVVMAPAVVESPKTRNSKRALKNWRIVLDKVAAAQFLVGSEESVQSWLQTEVISEGSSQPSCVLLAEEIKGAERMPSLKSKMVAPVMDEAGCRHPANRLQRGGNQYTGWVTCMDCFARWKVARLPKKEKTSSKKDVASRMAQLALESPAAVVKGQLQPGQVHERSGREDEDRVEEVRDCRAEECGADCPKVEDRGSRDQEADRGVEAGTNAVSAFDQDTPVRDEGGQVVAERLQEDYEDARDDDVRACHHGDGWKVPGAKGVLGRRDVELGRAEVVTRGGLRDVEHSPEGEREVHGGDGRSEPCRSFDQQSSPGEEEGQVCVAIPGDEEMKSSEEWIWTRRLKKELEKIHDSGFFVVEEIVVREASGDYVVEPEEVDSEDEGFLRMDLSKKLRMEDEVEDVKETSLSKEQKKKLRRAEADHEKNLEVLAVGVSEVFSPPRISKEAERRHMRVGKAYDLKTGYDLKEEKDRRRMWKELHQDDPELVTGSPPCTPFSILQSLNLPKMEKARAVHMVGEGLLHVSTTVQVCKWQYRRGKLFLFEHPRGSRAFEEEEVLELMQLPGVYVCEADMCQYGMNVDGRGLNQKPTRWITNSRHIARLLQRRCKGGHQHVALMGGLAKKAAEYPAELCKMVVKGLKEHLREKYGCPKKMDQSSAILLGEGGPGGEKDEEDSSSSSSESSSEDEEEAKKLMGRVRVLKQMEDAGGRVQITKEEKNKLRIMHVNLGHPSKASFVRFLRAGRVREELIRWVRSDFECATCQSNVLPKAPRPAVVPRGYAPGVAVGIGLFYVLENKEPAHIWRTFWRVWARTFGLPQYVAIDEGREFRSHFAKLCASAGTIVFRSAARAPWQQGRVERHGSILKTMLEKSREEMVPSTPDELLHLLHACECAKNRFSNRSGYSPTQRQIGQWPRMPSSLVSDEEIDPSLQAQNCTDDFEKLMEMRRIAQNAFMKMNCGEAAVKALKARPRIQRTFKAGDVVYVYRALRKRKTIHGGGAVRGGGMGRKATWVGPGHVLALEGSVVWINMMGELWRAAVEQVRMASSTEKLGSELIAEHCEEMQERLKRSAHRSGYRDVSADEWPEMEKEDDKQEDGEVDREGEERGRPRVRFEESGPQEEGHHDRLDDDEIDELFRPEEDGGASLQRRVSVQTEAEPEGEISVPGASVLDEERAELEEREVDDMARSVEDNERRDGVDRRYEAIRGQVRQQWRRRLETPYFMEMEFFMVGTAEEKEEINEKKNRDYWVFNPCRNVLQRHHVAYQKEKDGEERVVSDEWSLFSRLEEKFNWWKGITEFKVDPHFLHVATEAAGPNMKKKRGEGEVFPHEIEKEEWPLWQKQDQEEFGKIVESGALRVLSLEESRAVKERLKKEGKLDRVLPSRMVRRYKPGDAPGAPRTRKSRFCIRGDRDPDAIQLARFAPTVTTSNLQVLIQAAVNRGYRGVVGDLKSAFCQSMPLVRENGPIYCKSHHGSMPGLHEEQIAEIVLGCYGLMDAPLNWRKTLVKFVKEELHYKQSALDPCTYLLHEGGRLRGLLAIEVDDLLMFGDEEHEKRMEQLQKRFTFGKLEEIGPEGVNFNGRRLRKKDGEVLVDMRAFVEERLMPVEMEAERLKQRSEKITEEERSKVRSTCGALNWAGREGRPDAAAAASLFSSQMLEMTVQDVVELNRVVARLKKTSNMALRIQPIPEERLRWGVISDASYANARNGKTQAGVGDLLWMMAMYYELTEPDFQLMEWRKRIGKKGYTAFSKKQKDERLEEALAVIDAKSLYDLLNNETTGGSDRRTALDIQVLREELQALQGRIRWIEHLQMPADCLTKKQGRKFYKVDSNDKVTRLRRECPQDQCGPGVFMAMHFNRYYCGKCSLTYLIKKEG